MIRALFIATACLVAAPAAATDGSKGAVVLPPSSAAAAGGERLALLVGVREFDDARWPDLRFTAADATALGTELEQNGYVTRVLGGGATTREELLAALAQLQARNLTADDTVVLYLSTHGTLSRRVDGTLAQVLVLSDTTHAQPLDSGILFDELLERFEALRSRRKVLILATCYSGAGKSSWSDAVASYVSGLKGPPSQPLYDVSRATVVLSASAWGEPAREDDGLGHDIYTHYLLQALRGYDPNGDGAVSVTEAHDFARRQTYEFTGGAQRPTAVLTVEGEDPIVLAGKRERSGKPVLLAYESRFDGYRVQVDGRAKGELPGGIVVEPGWREVALLKPGADGEATEVWRRRVRLQPGRRLALVEVMEREPDRQLTLRGRVQSLPRANLGTGRGFGGGVALTYRQQGWPVAGLDAGLTAGASYGREQWRVNRESFDVDLLVADLALRLGPRWTIGRVVLHLEAEAGGIYLRRDVDSPFFDSPRHAFAARFGAAGAARLRLGESASIGLDAGAAYLVGDLSGLLIEAGLNAAWSF